MTILIISWINYWLNLAPVSFPHFTMYYLFRAFSRLTFVLMSSNPIFCCRFFLMDRLFLLRINFRICGVTHGRLSLDFVFPWGMWFSTAFRTASLSFIHISQCSPLTPLPHRKTPTQALQLNARSLCQSLVTSSRWKDPGNEVFCVR